MRGDTERGPAHDHTEAKASGALATVVLGVLGPFLAVLHLLNALPFGLQGSLLGPGVVAVAAALGLAAGVLAIRRDHRAVGTAVALLNLLVLAPYGFLAVFFGLGGSR